MPTPPPWQTILASRRSAAGTTTLGDVYELIEASLQVGVVEDLIASALGMAPGYALALHTLSHLKPTIAADRATRAVLDPSLSDELAVSWGVLLRCVVRRQHVDPLIQALTDAPRSRGHLVALALVRLVLDGAVDSIECDRIRWALQGHDDKLVREIASETFDASPV